MTDESLMTQDSFPKLTDTNSRSALIYEGGSCTHAELNQRINRFGSGLLEDGDDLSEERIALYMPGNLAYVTALMGIWRAGGVAVPLNIRSAGPELEYALTCAGVTRLVVDSESHEKVAALCASLDIEISSVDRVLRSETRPLPAMTNMDLTRPAATLSAMTSEPAPMAVPVTGPTM